MHFQRKKILYDQYYFQHIQNEDYKTLRAGKAFHSSQGNPTKDIQSALLAGNAWSGRARPQRPSVFVQNAAPAVVVAHWTLIPKALV